jgi:hypothetical protein
MTRTAPLLITLLAASLFLVLGEIRPAAPASPPAWDASDATWENYRREVYRSRSLVGLTPGQVDSLLGPPTARYAEASGDDQHEYDLGPTRSLFGSGSDHDYLLVRFRNGKAVKAWQTTG